MPTSEQTKQELINSLKQSSYLKVQNFANAIGDKCWDELATEFYNLQFNNDEKNDIFIRLMQSTDPIVKKILVIFLEKEDVSVINQILQTADINMKKFIARYSSSDNVRQTMLGQNPDKGLLKEIIAGMIDKTLVSQYATSNDEELRQAYFTKIRKNDFIKRIWR